MGRKLDRKDLIAKANQYFGQGRYEDAVLYYLEARARTPEIAGSVMLNINLAQKRSGHELRVNELDDNSNLRTNFGGSPLSNIRVNLVSDYEGTIEAANAHCITGWAVYKQSRTTVFEIPVIVNHIKYLTVTNNLQRGDLKRAGKSTGLGGFELKFPKGLLDQGENTISIVLPDGKTLSKKVVVNERSPVNSGCYFKGVTSLSIVVPIYNALADVKRCVARLSLYTPDNVRVFLINDGSSDPEIKRFLDNCIADPRFIVSHNDENLGFTKTVNIGIELGGMDDVIILNSDARVTPRWVEGIIRAADSDPRVATVTPMSDRAGAFSAPHIGNENDLPDGVDEESYAVAFRRRGYGYYPVVPTGNGYCMFIRRSCILDIGLLDEVAFPKGYGEENDLCMRARENGWINIIDDRTYIFHDRNKSFGEKKNELISRGRKVLDERYPDYGKAIQVFSVNPLIAAARFKAKQAVTDLEGGIGQIKPRVLFVVSTLENIIVGTQYSVQ